MKTKENCWDISKKNFYSNLKSRKDEIEEELEAAKEATSFTDFDNFEKTNTEYAFLRSMLGTVDKCGTQFDYCGLLHLPKIKWTDSEDNTYIRTFIGTHTPGYYGFLTPGNVTSSNDTITVDIIEPNDDTEDDRKISLSVNTDTVQTALKNETGYAANTYLKVVNNGTTEEPNLGLEWVNLGGLVQENLIQWDDTTKELFKGEEGKYTIVDDILLGDTTVLNRIKAKSTVTASATGTATDEVSYITIDGTEKKISGGITETKVDEKISSAKTELEGEIETAVAVETERALAAENTLQDNIDKKQDTISDLATIRSGAALGTTSVQPATLTDYYNKDETDTQIDTKISQSVGRYITSSTAGANFATKAALTAGPYYYNGETATLIATDYAIVAADEDHESAQTRYIYSGSQWNYQYTISTTITAAQQAALDSGATSTLIGQITTNKTNITSNTAAIEANATAITNCEKTANKTTSLTTASTDTEYPSAKATFDAIDEVYEDLQSELENKLDKVSDAAKVYVTSGTGTQSTISYGTSASASTIPVRTDTGALNVGTPTEDDNATTKKYVDEQVSNCEKTANKVTELSSESTDTQYPTAKCVYDLVGTVETILTTLNTGTGAK